MDRAPAWRGAMVLLAAFLATAAGCRSSHQTNPPPADAGGEVSLTDVASTDVASEAATPCFCTTRTAVSVGTCRFARSCPPGDSVGFSVKVDGAMVARDTTHANGWDYTTADMGTIQLFGAACPQATTGTPTVTLDYSCPPP